MNDFVSKLPVNVEIANTFADCMLFKTKSGHYIITKFRDRFLKTRLTKKEFQEILNNNK